VFPLSAMRENRVTVSRVTRAPASRGFAQRPATTSSPNDAASWSLAARSLELDAAADLVEFGPVIERVVPDENGFRGAIDLESGNVVAYPPQWSKAAQTQPAAEELRWRRELGVDA